MIDEDLKIKLKHNKQTFIDKEFIKEFLWYSYNNQCPIQTNRQYENSWFNKLEANIYCAIVFKQILGLDAIKFLSKDDSIEDEIKNNSFRNVLFVKKNKELETIFESFFNKLRNSIAHGTFNNVKDTFYFVGQAKAKIESPINYYLKLSKTSIKNIHKCLNKVIKILEVGDLYEILTLIVKISKRKTFYYFQDEKKQEFKVIIDNSSDKMSKESVDSLLNEYIKESNSVIIICSSINKNIKNENLQSEDGKIRVIDYRHIVETFNLKNIYLG